MGAQDPYGGSLVNESTHGVYQQVVYGEVPRALPTKITSSEGSYFLVRVRRLELLVSRPPAVRFTN